MADERCYTTNGISKLTQGVTTDYEELARGFLSHGPGSFRGGPQHHIDEAMRGENFVLMYLSQHHDSVAPSSIGAAMGVSTARVAAALNGLESKGLITRQIDADDRRRILVDLTPDGRCLIERRQQELLDYTTRVFAYLGEPDAAEFVRIWGRLTEARLQVPGAG